MNSIISDFSLAVLIDFKYGAKIYSGYATSCSIKYGPSRKTTPAGQGGQAVI